MLFRICFWVGSGTVRNYAYCFNILNMASFSTWWMWDISSFITSSNENI